MADPHFAMITGPRWGTKEWLKFRQGMVTASRFHDVMTPPKTKAAQEAGEWGATAMKYLWELVTATVYGTQEEGYESPAMRWGKDKEADAIDHYCRERFLFPGDWSEGRILRIDDTTIGATPDAMIEVDPEGTGSLQVKCPEPHNFMRLWYEHQQCLRQGIQPPIPEEYKEQAQGELWVSEREWCDFIHFDPRAPFNMQMFVVRVPRDNEYIHGTLEPKIRAFAEMVQERVAEVRAFLAQASPQEAAAVRSALVSEEDPTNLFSGL